MAQRRVDLPELIENPGQGKLSLYQGAAGGAHPATQLTISYEALECVAQLLDVVRWDQQAVDSVLDDIPATRHVGCNQREAARRRLHQYPGHTFPVVSWETY